jgi:hypothetical protein
MTTISLTLTDRQYDGFITAANGAGMTPEALAEEFLAQQGARYADGFKIGVITGAAFVARFTPAEYGAILGFAADIQPVPEAVMYVPTTEEQAAYDAAVATYEALEDPTQEETDTYQAAVAAYQALLVVTNQAEIDAAVVANASHEAVAALVDQLTASPNVALDDPRLAPGLALLVSEGLLDAARPAEILAYERPTPEVQG